MHIYIHENHTLIIHYCLAPVVMKRLYQDSRKIPKTKDADITFMHLLNILCKLVHSYCHHKASFPSLHLMELLNENVSETFCVDLLPDCNIQLFYPPCIWCM